MNKPKIALEVVPLLAVRLGLPFRTAIIIDRMLANGGFRKKGRGRAAPAYNRREGILFIVAVLACKPSIAAAKAAAFWRGVVSDDGRTLLDALLGVCKMLETGDLLPENVEVVIAGDFAKIIQSDTTGATQVIFQKKDVIKKRMANGPPISAVGIRHSIDGQVLAELVKHAAK